MRNKLEIRLEAIDEACTHSLGHGALNSELDRVRDELRMQAVREYTRDQADAKYEFRLDMSTIEDLLDDAECPLSDPEMVMQFEHERGRDTWPRFCTAMNALIAAGRVKLEPLGGGAVDGYALAATIRRERTDQ